MRCAKCDRPVLPGEVDDTGICDDCRADEAKREWHPEDHRETPPGF